MANRLVNSNRQKIKEQLKPKNVAKATDFTNKNNETVKSNDDENDSRNKNVTSVTFSTNLKINNHTRNRLQAMAILGLATSQKDAVDMALSAYLDTLTNKQREEINIQVQSLEHRDTVRKNK